MDNNPNSNQHLSTLLQEAIQAGFSNDFRISLSGELYCINSGKQYASCEISLEPVLSTDCWATLYWVTASDGTLGTYVYFWE